MTFCATLLAAAGAAAKSAGLPQMNVPDFAPQLIWLALTFGLLYILMSRVALPRIGEVIGERHQRIQRDLGEAQRLKAETEKALAAYEQALADARGKAGVIAKETRERLAAETEKERGAVEAQVAAKVIEAEKRIQEMKSGALAQVNGIAAETASAVVEKLIGRKVEAGAIQRALASTARG